MPWWSRLFRRTSAEADLETEIRFHLNEETQLRVDRGEPPDQAAYAARRDFGNVGLVKETTRDVWGWTLLQTVARHIRYSARLLRRSPSFAAVAVLSLAIGIGATTTLFSIINTLTWRSLPVAQPDRLYRLAHAGSAGTSDSANYAVYEAVRSRSAVSGALLTSGHERMRVTVNGQAEVVGGQTVTGDYFSVLGVSTVLGRPILPEDEPGSTPRPVAVISSAYWQRRFGGATDVIGRVLIVDQAPHTIVGVAPSDFYGLQIGEPIDVSIPIDGSNEDRHSWLSSPIVVRLAPGVTREAAEAELGVALQGYLDTRNIDAQRRQRVFQRAVLLPIWNGLDGLRRPYLRPLTIVLSIVGVLLMLFCINLTNLTLARASARGRELALRLAMGATRAELVGLMVTESVLLAAIGGLIGLLGSAWSVRFLVGYLPLESDLHIPLDANVWTFVAGLSLGVGVIVGAAPAWLASGTDLGPSLAKSERSVVPGTLTLGKGLVVLQVALSLILAIAAALFAVSLRNLKNQDMGFDARNVLIVTMDADGTGVEGPALTAVHQQILDGLRTIPGVQHASLMTIHPLSGNQDGKPVTIPGFVPRTRDDNVVNVNTVGPDYFETLGIPIVAGRAISAIDTADAPRVAVISESMARHYFQGGNPMGQRIDISGGRPVKGVEIVGIARDAMYEGLRAGRQRMLYVPFFQRSAEGEYVFALRSAIPPLALERAARAHIESVTRTIPVTQVRTYGDEINSTLGNERLLATLGSGFAITAIALAAVGIYGVVAYATARRRREMSLRLALGARPVDIVRLIVGGVLGPVAVGVVAGALVALGMSRLVTSILYGIEPWNPAVYVMDGLVMLLVGAAAGLVPALRASRIQPMTSLSAE
jgi:predicted permease